jgi:hypothetical protein
MTSQFRTRIIINKEKSLLIFKVQTKNGAVKFFTLLQF